MTKEKVFLVIIFFLAFFLRFYRLADHPAGFHIDEASLGYNAYSLLKTGRDENGQRFPLHIDMFGDFRPAGYQYLDVIPVRILGLTELATRLPSALFGALTPLVIFLLAQAIFGNRTLSFLAAFLMVFSPWHLVVSRASAETVVALFFIILGAYFFILASQGKTKKLFWSIFCWSLSLFFYHVPRVFVPGLALVLGGLVYPLGLKKGQGFGFWAILSVGLVFLLSLVLIFGSGGGSGRFQQVSIFHFPEIRLVLEEQIREDGVSRVPLILTRTFHNKLVNYAFGYLQEYGRYFSLDFLFLKGGLPPWYVVPGMGLMYLVELPFFFWGLFKLVGESGVLSGKKIRPEKRLFLIPLLWLVLGPMVAAVTRDDVPNLQRSLVMLPALILITAYGFWTGGSLLKEKWGWGVLRGLVVVLGLAFCWNFGYFFHQYFIHTRVHQPRFRFNGFKEMVLAVDRVAGQYDQVLVTKDQGGIYMHFLFFQRFDPAEYQRLGSPKDQDYHGFGKVVFVPQACPPLGGEEKILAVASSQCQEAPFTGGATTPILREDNSVVFQIFPRIEEAVD